MPITTIQLQTDTRDELWKLKERLSYDKFLKLLIKEHKEKEKK